MVKEVEVDNLIDKAIIKSFDKAEKGMLKRKAIIQLVKSRIDEKEPDIVTRITKLSKEPFNYLIRKEPTYHSKVERKTDRMWYVYQLNPELEFTFIGEPLPSETRPHDISPMAREGHTKDLQSIIKNWIENFPKVPESENCDDFRLEVEKCESFPLFRDLSVHLSNSGYNICQNWERYKKDIEELQRDKKAALKLIEKRISDIFKGLRLTFVKHYNNLRDSGCAYAYLIYSNLIYVRLGIRRVNQKYPTCSDEEDNDKFLYGLSKFEDWSNMVKDRLNEMIIFKENDSAIWGEDNTIFERYPYPERWECIRVPAKDIESLKKGKDEATSFFPVLTPEIDRSINEIVERMIRLEDKRKAIMDELQDSLYCKSFQGECKYLGAPTRE